MEGCKIFQEHSVLSAQESNKTFYPLDLHPRFKFHPIVFLVVLCFWYTRYCLGISILGYSPQDICILYLSLSFLL